MFVGGNGSNSHSRGAFLGGNGVGPWLLLLWEVL